MLRDVRRPLQLLFVALILFVSASPSWSAWEPNGTAICTATSWQDNPQIVSDGLGGAIIVWEDDRNGATIDIYAQYISGSGIALWPTDGVQVCALDEHQRYPKAVSDGLAGAIVVWTDYRAGTPEGDIYAQRIDPQGNILWSVDGRPVAATDDDEEYPEIISDGMGGAIITWTVYRDSSHDIYAQRLDENGAALWAPPNASLSSENGSRQVPDGIPVCTAVDTQWFSTLASDGAGGAIITWSDGRTGGPLDIYAQRIDSQGSASWTVDGVPVCTAAGVQRFPLIVPDDAGGGIIAWEDQRVGADWNIYAQGIDASGTTQWTADGIALCSDADDQTSLALISDGEGGAIAGWTDARDSNYEVYVQRVTPSGATLWTADGVNPMPNPRAESTPALVSDGAGGSIVVCLAAGGGYANVYAGLVDASGTSQWSPDGVPLRADDGLQMPPVAATDGAGGAIAAWPGSRDMDYAVYADRITNEGLSSGAGTPSFSSLLDHPNDQGGAALVTWTASLLDSFPNEVISHYSVWRKYEGISSAPARNKTPPIEAAVSAGMYRRLAVRMASYGWEFVSESPAIYRDEYSMTVPTYGDSTASGIPYCTVMVVAHTEDPWTFFESAPESVYSVDDLSPCAPVALAAEYVGGTDVYLHWNPNTEADIHHYAIYRGTEPGFVPGDTNRLGTSTDSSFVDSGFGYGEYYYKVSAIDIHDNESPFSLLTPDMITGIPGSAPKHENVLFQNAPNPFVSSTRIAFSMKERGHVRLTVFDAKGRLVRVLADEVRDQSHYVEPWDGTDGDGRLVPTGTYFYRLEAPGWNASKKMTLAR